MPDSIVTNEDCMELMSRYEDKYFDLAVVDPPYGIGRDGAKEIINKKTGKVHRKAHQFKGWDKKIPKKEYFDELFRISKNQIIWGGNYFTKHLPASMGWIFWDKGQELTMSDGELAFTSFEKALRKVLIYRIELAKEGTFHPTQKPIKLYDWIFLNYAKQGDKILDTHLGSGSSRIAAYKCGLDFVGCELDTEYFEKQEKRFEAFTSQLTLF